ncbi:transposase [Streptomyces sp. NPDC018610]|uniref:transposase n=1 Tax=Streptomyces sp. NPDC018610 TaxID=3365049 RepID=UPI0037B9E382
MGDNPERLNTKASFAALCGVSPIEYSSGRRRTCRLNHGGDRQANAALHRIVFTRLRHDPRTQAYYERRTQEGKIRREIIRCLKRYAVREVFNLVRPVSRTPALEGGPFEMSGSPAMIRPRPLGSCLAAALPVIKEARLHDHWGGGRERGTRSRPGGA